MKEFATLKNKTRVASLLLATVLATVLTTLLASCNFEDEDTAYTLVGTWKGNMYIRSEYDGRFYDALYTEVTFLKDSYEFAKGTGYWVDYYDRSTPWDRDYVAYHIEWEVDHGRIYIYFAETGKEISIDDYHLSKKHFSGTIYNNGEIADFDLVNIARRYYDNYYWGYYYSRPTRSDSTQTAEQPQRILHDATDGQQTEK